MANLGKAVKGKSRKKGAGKKGKEGGKVSHGAAVAREHRRDLTRDV